MRGRGMGMGMGRAWRRDQSVLEQQVTPGTVRRVLRLALSYKKLLALFLFLVVVDAVLGTINPLILRDIINNGIGGHDSQLVVQLAILAAGIATLDMVVTLVERYVSARIGESLIFDLRRRVFAHVQRMPIAFFTRTQTGALVSRLNNDIIGAQQAFTNTLGSVVSNIITVVIVFVAMLALSWQITLASLALLPVFIIPARYVGKKLQTLTRDRYIVTAAMNNTMTERFNVAGALLVKLFGTPDREQVGFEADAARVRDLGVTSSLYNGYFYSGMFLLTSLATALVYGWGGVLTVNGVLDIGTIVALTAYLQRLYGPLNQLSGVQIDVMTALVSFDRVFEVLDLEPSIDEKPGAVDVPAGPARIEFSHVDFRYPRADEVSLASLESVAVLDQTPNHQVLFDVSFTAEPGELVALVGHSGAGKTTISNLVPRLYDVRAGAIRINGVDLRDTTLSSIQDTIGVVTQDAHLFHDTIRANLAYARPDATEDDMRAALRAAQILPLVESLPDGLETVVGDRGYRFSGGEKQRIAIARLLLKAPRIVVLDEATAHLDSESEVAVQAALETALAGRTSIVIAHRLSTVRHADKILVVSGGRIVETGTHEELLRRGGVYAELYDTQFRRQAALEDVTTAAQPTT
ncbi:MAG TPA: ABC transporter ATP-binding protein [Acidimicrobiia bacterium]|nr:ABC transporter ATP-binding protein [Acidimicrobiia bacterium]